MMNSPTTTTSSSSAQQANGPQPVISPMSKIIFIQRYAKYACRTPDKAVQLAFVDTHFYDTMVHFNTIHIITFNLIENNLWKRFQNRCLFDFRDDSDYPVDDDVIEYYPDEICAWKLIQSDLSVTERSVMNRTMSALEWLIDHDRQFLFRQLVLPGRDEHVRAILEFESKFCWLSKYALRSWTRCSGTVLQVLASATPNMSTVNRFLLVRSAVSGGDYCFEKAVILLQAAASKPPSNTDEEKMFSTELHLILSSCVLPSLFPPYATSCFLRCCQVLNRCELLDATFLFDSALENKCKNLLHDAVWYGESSNNWFDELSFIIDKHRQLGTLTDILDVGSPLVFEGSLIHSLLHDPAESDPRNHGWRRERTITSVDSRLRAVGMILDLYVECDLFHWLSGFLSWLVAYIADVNSGYVVVYVDVYLFENVLQKTLEGLMESNLCLLQEGLLLVFPNAVGRSVFMMLGAYFESEEAFEREKTILYEKSDKTCELPWEYDTTWDHCAPVDYAISWEQCVSEFRKRFKGQLLPCDSAGSDGQRRCREEEE
jgi:hypothetical protein